MGACARDYSRICVCLSCCHEHFSDHFTVFCFISSIPFQNKDFAEQSAVEKGPRGVTWRGREVTCSNLSWSFALQPPHLTFPYLSVHRHHRSKWCPPSKPTAFFLEVVWTGSLSWPQTLPEEKLQTGVTAQLICPKLQYTRDTRPFDGLGRRNLGSLLSCSL